MPCTPGRKLTEPACNPMVLALLLLSYAISSCQAAFGDPAVLEKVSSMQKQFMQALARKRLHLCDKGTS